MFLMSAFSAPYIEKNSVMNRLSISLLCIWTVFALVFFVSLFCQPALFFTICNYAYAVFTLPLVAGVFALLGSIIKEKHKKD